MTGILASQPGGTGGPVSSARRAAAAISFTLSASVVPMIANGARTTIIMASVIVAAANVLRPRNHLSTRWYSGQVEKHSTTAHSSADTNGHKTRRQPTTTI